MHGCAHAAEQTMDSTHVDANTHLSICSFYKCVYVLVSVDILAEILTPNILDCPCHAC